MTGAAEEAYSGPPVKTFVFLDLETTGLPGPGRRPRVVELSVVAIHRQNLVTPCQGDEPRVLDKLTLCVYPMRNIDPGASAVTGLYTDAVYPLKDLDDNFVQSLDLFLRRHEAPICLVAHNGNKFDFPLLQSELMSLGKELPGDILCVDSLLAFRDIEGGIIIPAARELSDSVTEAKGSPPSNSINDARLQETPRKLSDVNNAASSSNIDDARPQETPYKLPDNAASSSENIVLRDASDTESNQKRQRLNPRRLDFTPAENQTNPAENQTNPAENQTNPAENQTNPAENLTNTTENQTNPAENQTNTAENQTNTESKRQRLNPRRLDFTPAGNQTNTEDFNCNVLEEVSGVNTGSPEGPPLLHDPLPSCSDWTHVKPELGNKKPSVVRRLTLEDNPVKTRSESLSEMSDNPVKTRSESLSEMSDDTLPFIGDNENETMSTLQQMSTFVYTESESLGAGDQLSACSTKISSLSSLDSQKTVTYPLAMEQSDSTSQSIPERNQMSSLTDLELGEMEIPGDNQISMMEIPDQNHATVKNIENPNSLKTNGISPSENENHPSVSKPGSEALGTDVQNSVNNQTNGFPNKEFPGKPHGIPVSIHDSPPCTPSREECPPELKEQLAKLGTHAPRKNPPGKAVSRRVNPVDRGFKPYEVRLSYKLSVLHKRVLGYAPPRSHSAEDDAMALLRLFHREATRLLPWADTHAVPLNSIPLLYAVKRRTPLPDGTFPQYL